MRAVLRLFLFFVLVFVSAISMSLGLQKTVYAIDHLRTADTEMRKFVTVYDEILQNYVEVEEASPELLIEGAIHGMLQKLDPFSQFFPPTDYKQFTEATQGEFGGLGIRILIARPDDRWLPGWLTVVSPIEGAPSTRCKAVLDGVEYVGLKPDDKIVKIEKDSTRNMTLEEAVERLKGPPGTSVNIQVARKPVGADPILLDFEIERDIISVPAIEDKDIRMLNDRIGYIWLKDFTAHAHEALHTAINDLKGQGMEALVLDLRNNTGGLLQVAIEVCEMFIEKGEVIVRVDARNERDSETYTSRKLPLFDLPMVVLTNQHSASASEIIAGCIQDHKRGLIIGPGPKVNTYGKGSVQTLIKLEDGAGLKLTTALWFTPDNQKIHNQGIQPNLWSDMDSEYWIQLLQNEKVGYLLPGLLKNQVEQTDKETEVKADVTIEELLGSGKVSDEIKNLYDKQLFLAAQVLEVSLKNRTTEPDQISEADDSSE